MGSTNPGSRNSGFDLDKFQNVSEPQSPHLKEEVMIHSTSENGF